MPLRDTIRLTYGASRYHTAHLWRFAPYGSCYAYGSPLGTPYGSAARLCSRCLRQRGEHTPCLRAMLSLPAATWRAYARFESAPLGRFFRLWRPSGDAIRLILRLWRPSGDAIRLILRLWLPSGDAIRLRRTAMFSLPAATRRTYAVRF